MVYGGFVALLVYRKTMENSISSFCGIELYLGFQRIFPYQANDTQEGPGGGEVADCSYRPIDHASFWGTS